MNAHNTNPPERNAQVHAEHKREVSQQIYLPVIIGLLIILAGVIAIIIYGVQAGSNLRRWADVSLIWVIIPAMFIGVVMMVVVIGALYGITRVLGILPGYSKIVQGYFQQADIKVAQVTNGIVEPILKVRSSWAVVKRRDRIMTSRDHDK
jgi:FtsH-binding integral membrane protein